MKKITIHWLVDSYNCGQPGCSGGYSEGFRAYLDGELLDEFIPQAHCYGGDTCDSDQAYARIFAKLGYEVTEEFKND